jgi:hypothetical protein
LEQVRARAVTAVAEPGGEDERVVSHCDDAHTAVSTRGQARDRSHRATIDAEDEWSRGIGDEKSQSCVALERETAERQSGDARLRGRWPGNARRRLLVRRRLRVVFSSQSSSDSGDHSRGDDSDRNPKPG